MAWRLDYIEGARVVVLTFTGVIPGPELLEAAAARIAEGKDKNTTRFIIDAKEMIVSRSATMDVYRIPTEVYQKSDAARSSRIAVIKPSDTDSQWIGKFYDDLCTTRGWTAEFFSDRKAALDWLQSP